jgi:magnesium-transporting ATPase (P-type)
LTDLFSPLRVASDSQPLTLLANTLVPGDLVTFSVGDRVPADVRLISAVGLEVDESALTGETKPAKKRTDAVRSDEHHDDGGKTGGLALSERKCVAFMGTLVRNGEFDPAIAQGENVRSLTSRREQVTDLESLSEREPRPSSESSSR